MRKILLLFIVSVIWLKGYSQSATYINGNFDINAGVPTTWYGDVTFGPEAVVYLEDGATAIFYGKNMTIDPAARFICLPSNGQTGTGLIIFRANNPLYPGYPAQQTLNGGYAAGVNPSLPNIEIDNASGVSLSGNTRVTNTIKFTAGHLILNNFNIVLDDDATFTGYDVNKHVVTNGTGVIVKENLATGNSFLFPVSIAGLDYTPATVSNQIAVRNINVQVKNYSSSAAVETSFTTKGMDRTWQISSNIAGAANIVLQHNTATNGNGTGTDETAFNNALAFVSQQVSQGVWSTSCTGTNGGSPISINTGNNLILPGGINATAYFTKQTVSCADLMVTKTVNNAMPVIGSNLTFTIVVKNNGAANATVVKVMDQLPTGYDYVSSTTSSGVYSNGTGIWTIGDLANGASVTLTVTAIVKSTGSYANTAAVSGNEEDPDLTNNSSTVNPVPGLIQANLGVVKTVNNLSPTVGENVVFTIVANNVGPNAATNVIVTDQLPAGYTFVNANATVGSFDATTGKWTIGGLANGASVTLTITARVNSSGPYSNTAVVVGTESDPVPGNNSSTVTPVPNAALVDLSINKSTALATTAIGDEFVYDLVVRNKGANLATNVTVSDVLPVGLTFISASSNNGTVSYDLASRTLTWTIGQVSTASSVSLTLRVKADLAGIITNTATVTATERDINPADNTSTAVKEIFGLKIPNLFTPNGDGRNDTFVILGLNAYPENNVAIFNRWGNEVYHSNGAYKNDWTGEGLNSGTYYYLLKLKDLNGKWHVYKGFLTLLRTN